MATVDMLFCRSACEWESISSAGSIESNGRAFERATCHYHILIATLSLLTKNSFIQAISIVPLQAHYYISQILCGSFTPKRHRQLQLKDLPKVPTWRLDQNLSLWPFRRKATNQPMSHHALKMYLLPLHIFRVSFTDSKPLEMIV